MSAKIPRLAVVDTRTIAVSMEILCSRQSFEGDSRNSFTRRTERNTQVVDVPCGLVKYQSVNKDGDALVASHGKPFRIRLG